MPLNFECHQLRGGPRSRRNGSSKPPSRLAGGREGRRRRRNERNNLLIKRRLSPGGRAPFTNKLICQDRLVLLIVGRIRGESESRVNATRARSGESQRERRALVAETDIGLSDSSASCGKGRRGGRQGRVTRAEPTAGNQMRCEAGGASREGSGRRAWTPPLSTQTRR